ncbi:MAG: hypothetical protein ACLST7_11435, partial [Oscillospiraceae bacterium]
HSTRDRQAVSTLLPPSICAIYYTLSSAHRECHLRLPETAIVFFMSKGTDYLVGHPFTITNPLRIPFQIKFLVLRIISD